MLKGIPEILAPELLKVLCEMGHGDRLVIADGNFPVESMGKNSNVIRMDGHSKSDILEAVLRFFPLDTYVDKSVHLMAVVPGDEVETPIWKEYEKLVTCSDKRGIGTIGYLNRFDFYEEAKTAYSIIATGERALYANIMLQKGVVTDE